MAPWSGAPVKSLVLSWGPMVNLGGAPHKLEARAGAHLSSSPRCLPMPAAEREIEREREERWRGAMAMAMARRDGDGDGEA